MYRPIYLKTAQVARSAPMGAVIMIVTSTFGSLTPTATRLALDSDVVSRASFRACRSRESNTSSWPCLPGRRQRPSPSTKGCSASHMSPNPLISRSGADVGSRTLSSRSTSVSSQTSALRRRHTQPFS